MFQPVSMEENAWLKKAEKAVGKRRVDTGWKESEYLKKGMGMRPVSDISNS